MGDALLSFQDAGTINDLPVSEVIYPASWREAYKNGDLVSRWRAEKPGEFEEADSGMSGSPDLFAQSCLAYALSQQGYRSTMWYKLALDPVKSKSMERLNARQRFISDRVGGARMLALRQMLLDEHLTHIKGEPDLFAWRGTGDDWFFAEAKDQDTNDGLRFNQVRWMFAARRILGEKTPFRLYSLRSEPDGD